MVIAAMKLKDAYSLEGKLLQHIKKQRHYFVNKGLSSQDYGFSSGHVEELCHSPVKAVFALKTHFSG